ncbi:orotidine 5'-phosphate decarboxylase [Onygenales sp. PD_40]|nr:orotidine 5'-phosphate decarboxylase [Onygenales sp. PD_40]KAK2759225.1 orotidine 5'-phosphate decarboxylase [Emmonsiellopsis sp. PD_33]KAK2771723.1 orotidine 5'-phosphate decarboxylase [Onygenales sp. PD_12]KAK2803941.1 orotidine 5'-phosphate decarboxylase [Onygenales sp. PD_10]
MSSNSHMPYSVRASRHPNPLARRLFQIATEKKSNVVVSADVTTTKELLDLADLLGPYIVVLKTHIDILTDLTPTTLTSLTTLSQKHSFLLFEDRKFVDIGSTVQKQYHGGVLRISSWAHIVNCAMLPGPGIVDALAQTTTFPDFPKDEEQERGLLILAEMTSKGSTATGAYTSLSVDVARRHPGFVLGFVATRALGEVGDATTGSTRGDEEDFVVFTTGVNLESKGDALGQQYQTPKSAVGRGADFIIAGRGIYKAEDPVGAVRRYREEGWRAYEERVEGWRG